MSSLARLAGLGALGAAAVVGVALIFGPWREAPGAGDPPAVPVEVPGSAADDAAGDLTEPGQPLPAGADGGDRAAADAAVADQATDDAAARTAVAVSDPAAAPEPGQPAGQAAGAEADAEPADTALSVTDASDAATRATAPEAPPSAVATTPRPPIPAAGAPAPELDASAATDMPALSTPRAPGAGAGPVPVPQAGRAAARPLPGNAPAALGESAIDHAAAPPPVGSGDGPAAAVGGPRAPAAPSGSASLPNAGVALPAFDVVRAEPGGFTLVAGTAEPGARIDVLLDDVPVADAVADRDGGFVAFLDLPARAAPQVLRLRQSLGDSVLFSAADVVLAPREPPAPDEPNPGAAQPPETAPDGGSEQMAALSAQDTRPGQDLPRPEVTASAPDEPETAALPSANAADSVSIGDAPAPRTTTAPAAPTAPASGVPNRDLAAQATEPPRPEALDAPEGAALAQAPADADGPAAPLGSGPPAGGPVPPAPDAAAPSAPPVAFLSTEDGISVLARAPLPPGRVALDAISYDGAGDVLLSGRGGSGFVRVYLDNTPVTTSRIAEGGQWRVTLPEVDQGTYTLRVDQLDAAGQVTARVESPFRREDPATLAAAFGGLDGPAARVTVQPGNTLWGISRWRYGEGLAYVRVFEANRDSIRDPDLIYPGQVFELPAR